MSIKIDNVKIYDLDESVKASGYPMSTDKDNVRYDDKRAKKLAHNPPGTGHPNFLKGIKIAADITAGQYWWLQYGRYNFCDIVSSQSKMHRLTRMDIDRQCNQYVDDRIKDYLKQLIKKFNTGGCSFQKVVANCPMGLRLSARVTSNYLQEKTIYHQRREHKLQEWQEYCDWLESLPYSNFITSN